MLEQVVRAAFLDGRVYRNIGEGPEFMFRALGVVAVAGIAFGLGIRNASFQDIDSRTVVMLLAFSTMVMGWVIWSSVVYVIGTMLFRGRASHRTLLRAMGIAYGPGILLVLVGVPSAGFFFWVISVSWLLVAASVAVQETQGFGWLRSMVPTVLGWFLTQIFLPWFIVLPPASG